MKYYHSIKVCNVIVEDTDPSVLSKCNICFTYPCANGGTCQLTGFKKYKCQCAPGYHGDHCDDEIDACFGGPCDNGGSCKVIEKYGRFRYAAIVGFATITKLPESGVLCDNGLR